MCFARARSEHAARFHGSRSSDNISDSLCPQWCSRQLAKEYGKVNGEKHEDTLLALYNLGECLVALGKQAEAESAYQEALNGFNETLEAGHEYIRMCTDR